MARPPENQLSARGADALIGLYQATVSPVLTSAGVRCRFEPTCSEYARETIRNRGLAAGTLRTMARLVRCGPWTPAGTVDPVE
ncbi:MAG: membrane protein insertion efficiency factor YidD [Acidobacteriota bacterium]|nr:membrane protein insertion efficiency factor YidD [Acidobacteriota bacterium]MDE2921922.1 membrane protein insertion efficiency factor YidD [Acidobacteriota bacterium]MDE3265932.1 membrane protein insertion efficiency factor YidD [Acidobacteriota bacterium]